MRQDKTIAPGRGAFERAATLSVSEDEGGMRLDRWLHRRFPLISISHLMKIVRKGEVRVAGRRADVSTRLAAGESVRVPPLRPAAGQGPPAGRASPGDREAIRAMTLFEDRDVIVLNKPYGLAVQGGSGTKRHIDGMLEALADKSGRAPRSRPSARSRHFGRAADRQVAQDGGGTWRDLPLARRAQDLLGAGRRRAEAGAGAHLDVSCQGRGHGRSARRRAGQGGSRADAGRQSRR